MNALLAPCPSPAPGIKVPQQCPSPCPACPEPASLCLVQKKMQGAMDPHTVCLKGGSEGSGAQYFKGRAPSLSRTLRTPRHWDWRRKLQKNNSSLEHISSCCSELTSHLKSLLMFLCPYMDLFAMAFPEHSTLSVYLGGLSKVD